MTSKEALKSIEKQSTLDFLNYDSLCLFEQELKVIQKDLEVLDILRQNLIIEYSVSFYSDKITGRPARLGIKTPPAEQLEKIREWLNEKNND